MTIFNDDYEQYALEPMYSTKKTTIPYQEALLKRNSAIEFTQPPHELTQTQSGFPFTRIRVRLDTLTLPNQQQQLIPMWKKVAE